MFNRKEYMKIYNTKYYKENKGEIRKNHKIYYEENKKKISLRMATNPKLTEYRREKAVEWNNINRNKRRKMNKISRTKNINKVRIQHFVGNHLGLFLLNEKCIFCGVEDNLEHAHYSYEKPEYYVTACHQCNMWMDINAKEN